MLSLSSSSLLLLLWTIAFASCLKVRVTDLRDNIERVDMTVEVLSGGAMPYSLAECQDSNAPMYEDGHVGSTDESNRCL